MKLIYVANVRIPDEWAHGIQIMKMCEAFSKQGAEVEFLTAARRGKIKDEPFDYYGVKKIFKLIQLPALDFLPGSPSAWYFWWRTAVFLFFTKLFLSFKRYDILYAREQAIGLAFSNFVLEIHSLPEHIRPWHRKVWRKAAKLVVLTSFIKEQLIAEGIDGDKIMVAPDGVSLEDFDVKATKEELLQELGLPLDKKIIMYAGSFYLHDWKGTDILLESIKYFSPDWLLVLVGGEEREIEQIRKNYGSANVFLPGRQPHQKIPRYLKVADVLVLPNKKGEKISEKYTSPLKLFEYMAAGVPIVASDLPSIREILSDTNAVLVAPNESLKLAEGIKKTLMDKETAAQRAVQAWSDVQNYTWSVRAEKIISAIK